MKINAILNSIIPILIVTAASVFEERISHPQCTQDRQENKEMTDQTQLHYCCCKKNK
jgi:hypothetical protein